MARVRVRVRVKVRVRVRARVRVRVRVRVRDRVRVRVRIGMRVRVRVSQLACELRLGMCRSAVVLARRTLVLPSCGAAPSAVPLRTVTTKTESSTHSPGEG